MKPNTRLSNARGLVCALLSLALVSLCGAASAQDKVTLRLATYVNKVDVRYSWLQHFADLVRDRTQGRVNIQIFDSNTLHPFEKAIDAVIGGVSDISPVSGAGADRRAPCTHVVNFLPLSVDWSRIVELDLAVNEILNEELAKLGLIAILSQNANYDQEWWFKAPITKLDDLNGKLVRSVGPVITHVIERFGGKAVFISPSETYQATERGVVDAVNMGVATFSSWKLWGVMPHMVRSRMFYANVLYTMNKAKFDKLRPEDQKTILQASKESTEWLIPRYEAWIDQQVGVAVMQQGASVTTLPRSERQRLVAKAGAEWNKQIETGCGAEMAQRLRAVFKKYEG